MKEVNAGISRRSFLSSGALAAAVPSIIAIEALAAPKASATSPTNRKETTSAIMGNNPVYTDDTQTLTNKTIPSYQNTLGTDNVNVKEFYTGSNNDITTALNDALSFLDGTEHGGTILIPHGIWTTNGGHDLPNSVTVQGVGYNVNPLSTSFPQSPQYATELRLNSGQSSYMFRINATAPRQNVSLKNLLVNVSNNSTATGFLMTGAASSNTHIYLTHIENVGFFGGAYGVKVDSTSGHLEVILNSFDRVAFLGCSTGFYCNSVNGGYHFSNCYFRVPSNGTALNCEYMGNISVEHSLFGGSTFPAANVPQTDGSTILRTLGAYNNITFYDCQDENIEFYYQNGTNAYEDVPIVLRNCIVQSAFKYTASGSVIFDSCRINVTNISTSASGQISRILDGTNVAVRAYYNGATTLQRQVIPNPVTPMQHEQFVNTYSRTFYEASHVGLPTIIPVTTAAAPYTINKSRGAVTMGTGNSWLQIYNTLVTADSLVFAQLRTFDSGGARIREVQTGPGWIQINLTQNAANNLSIAFLVEG